MAKKKLCSDEGASVVVVKDERHVGTFQRVSVVSKVEPKKLRGHQRASVVSVKGEMHFLGFLEGVYDF